MCESVHVSMCTRRLGTVYSERRVCECVHVSMCTRRLGTVYSERRVCECVHVSMCVYTRRLQCTVSVRCAP